MEHVDTDVVALLTELLSARLSHGRERIFRDRVRLKPHSALAAPQTWTARPTSVRVETDGRTSPRRPSPTVDLPIPPSSRSSLSRVSTLLIFCSSHRHVRVNGKGKEKAALGNDHGLHGHSDWSHIAHPRSFHRISSLWSSPYRTRSTLSNSTVISPSERYGSSGVWKGKDVRHFGCRAQAMRYSDTGQVSPSCIVDRFVNGEPSPNASQPVGLKAAWSAFVELRKQSGPPQPSVVLGLSIALSLPSRIRSYTETKSRTCSVVAILGRFDDVTPYLSRIWDSQTNKEPYSLDHAELRMVETVLQALSRYRGPVAVLDFIVDEWLILGRLVNSSVSRRNSRAPSQLGEIAFKIFDQIPSPLAVVANMSGKLRITLAGSLLITFLVRRRAPEDALAVYREMQRQSVDIKPPLKLWLVRALVHGHAFEQANVLFSEISASVPFGYENELFLATALHLFSSQGDITRSEAAFKALQDRNIAGVRAVGMRLLAYAHNGDVETVLRYFHDHFPQDTQTGDRPNIFHYTAVLMAHAKACDSSGLNKWFGNMIADGVKPDRHIYNILLEDCIRRGKFQDVDSIIKEMRTLRLPPLAEAYTTILSALAKRKDPIMAETFYKKALKEGVKPDRQMVATLMTAHSAVSSWKGVIRAFDYLSSSDDRHLRPRIDVYNILLQAYVLAGSPFEVVSGVFQKMEQAGVRPTAHTFSILIKSACDSGRMKVAMRVFMELDSLSQKWETGIKVNVYALTVLMAGYLRLGNRLKAKEIYDEMIFAVLPPHLSRMAKPEQIEELMDDMVRAGGERTLTTLTLLLNSYRNAGNVDECQRVWDEILPIALDFLRTGELLGEPDPDLPRPDLQRRANIICIPLSIHMDALSAAGAHAEVADLWRMVREHGFALDSHNWNHLIVVLVRAGEIERAFQILERVIIPSFQHQARNHPTAPREMAPPTPLSYDDVPPPQKTSTLATEEAPPSRRTYLSTEARESVVAKLANEGAGLFHATPDCSTSNSSAQGEGRSTTDFAHPLYILQQILPSWDTWQPHAVVVTLLVDILDRLEDGHMITPIPPRRFENEGSTTWQGAESESSAAKELLGRIRASCPQAVAIVRGYDYRIRVRRELARMVDEG
ncbi:hypothetical protein BJV77DRAFT_1155979 [Russula vinacea]|nr:hypothetical protein BJV77DRAFT_1155979 [Russula vinacea]